MRGKKCGICPSSDKKYVAPRCLPAGTGPAGPIKIRTLYIRKREANASLVRIQLLMKLLVDTGTGLAGDTVATLSPPRFCKQKQRMDLK